MTTTQTERSARFRQIANIIIDQLGGQKFVAMTGASKLTAWDDAEPGILGGVAFKIGAGATDGINIIRIKLTAADDYTMEFIRIGRSPSFKTETVKTVEGVYCDMLADIFERTTGFRTSL